MSPSNRYETVSQQTEPEPRIILRPVKGGGRITLEAASLVAQYAVSDSDTLLVLDEDCPYEEQLHLVLVRGSKAIDHVVIGGMYSTGIFKSLGMDESKLRFTFESDAVWSLTVDTKGRRAWGGLPRGASRKGLPFGRKHLFLDQG